MTHSCSLLNTRHSHCTPYCSLTKGLVETRNRRLSTHLRLFLINSLDKWTTKTEMYANAHNTTLLLFKKISPYQFFFHTYPKIPLTFDLNFTRYSSQTCTMAFILIIKKLTWTHLFHLPKHKHCILVFSFQKNYAWKLLHSTKTYYF